MVVRIAGAAKGRVKDRQHLHRNERRLLDEELSVVEALLFGELILPSPHPLPLAAIAAGVEMVERRGYRVGRLPGEREAETELVDHADERVRGLHRVTCGDPLAVTREGTLHLSGERGCAPGTRSAILTGIATLRGGVTVNAQPRLIHLKSGSELGPKCGASDATSTTNWVRGASFPEVYVPAEVVGTADVVCRKCQEAAIDNDSGSDDEVVADEEIGAALADVSDAARLAGVARRPR